MNEVALRERILNIARYREMCQCSYHTVNRTKYIYIRLWISLSVILNKEVNLPHT